MKKLLLLSLCCCMGMETASYAQGKKAEEKNYLEGAVTEEEGKVVFTQSLSVTGLSKAEIYGRVANWMTDHMAGNQNVSRILLSDEEKGEIVALGDEWIVFSHGALSLDRTRICYVMTAKCDDNKCDFRIEKIKYIYREGKEKFVAEDMITDKVALNKTKTKIWPGMSKWRKKTVDFVDGLGLEIAAALNVSNVQMVHTTQAVTTPTPIVNATPATTAVTAATTWVEVDELPANTILANAGKVVVVIGDEPFNMTMMTANAGASVGKKEGKNVIFTIFTPEQNTTLLEQTTEYEVRFYPNGEKEPSAILKCQTQPAPQTFEGMPKTFIGTILKASVRK